MAARDRATLKTFFETGDVPTQVQFADLIDSFELLNSALSQIAVLADPGADRLLFWDDSVNAYVYLALGTNLSITGTTLNAALGSFTKAQLDTAVSDGNVLYVGDAPTAHNQAFSTIESLPTTLAGYGITDSVLLVNYAEGIGIDESFYRILLSIDNVNDTSDADKPVSTAQQTALDLKLNIADKPFAIVSVAASRILLLTDTQKYLRCSNASAMNITVPPQADVVWTADTEIVIEQTGAGQVTLVAGAGVTIHTSETLITAGQYSLVALKRVASNEWVLAGDRSLV